MDNDIRSVLYPEAAIHRRLDELAAQIAADYAGSPLSVVALLKGSCFFMTDLLRRLPLPLRLECLRVSSYAGQSSTGRVVFPDGPLPDLRGRRLLLLDDILDTGTTLRAVRERFEGESGASDIRTCVLLRKERPRVAEADYIGFTIPDVFVVGYGLDYNETYRNLPYIGILREECAR